MADVETTVRDGILRYPGLFSSRASVLHHILCVIGNGYEWVDGEAVAEDKNREVWTAEAEKADEGNAWIYMRPKELQAALLAHLDTQIAEQQAIVDNVDALAAEWGDLDGVYPQSDYALLMNIPGNLTPDWEAECHRMRQFVAQHGWNF